MPRDKQKLQWLPTQHQSTPSLAAKQPWEQIRSFWQIAEASSQSAESMESYEEPREKKRLADETEEARFDANDQRKRNRFDCPERFEDVSMLLRLHVGCAGSAIGAQRERHGGQRKERGTRYYICGLVLVLAISDHSDGQYGLITRSAPTSHYLHTQLHTTHNKGARAVFRVCCVYECNSVLCASLFSRAAAAAAAALQNPIVLSLSAVAVETLLFLERTSNSNSKTTRRNMEYNRKK